VQNNATDPKMTGALVRTPSLATGQRLLK